MGFAASAFFILCNVKMVVRHVPGTSYGGVTSVASSTRKCVNVGWLTAPHRAFACLVSCIRLSVVRNIGSSEAVKLAAACPSHTLNPSNGGGDSINPIFLISSMVVMRGRDEVGREGPPLGLGTGSLLLFLPRLWGLPGRTESDSPRYPVTDPDGHRFLDFGTRT